MREPLKTWLSKGWLKKHRSSRGEIDAIINTIQRDRKEARLAREHAFSPDRQLTISYNVIKLCAKAALAAFGYRPSKKQGSQYRLIQSLRHTLGLDHGTVVVIDKYRVKRNEVEYNRAGIVSQAEADQIFDLADSLFNNLHAWLKEKHPELLQDAD